MRKIVPVLLCLVLAACFDQPAPPTAPDGRVPGVDARAENTTPLVQHPEWRGYWRNDSTLWIYDRTPEVGSQTYRATSEQFDEMLEMGMRLARVTVFWNTAYNDSAEVAICNADTNCSLENAYTWALPRGVEIVGGLMPQCAAGGCDRWVVNGVLQVSRNDWYADYAHSLASLAREFPRIKYWQAWNEPDGGGHGIPWFANHSDVCGGGTINRVSQAQEYRKFLEVVYDSLHAINDGNRRYLIAAGLTGGVSAVEVDGQDPSVPCAGAREVPFQFVEEMYKAGAKPYFDFLGFHAYGAHIFDQWGAPQAVRELVNRITPYENGGQRPIWLTEFGNAAYNRTWGGDSIPKLMQRHGTGTTFKNWIDNEQTRYMSGMFDFQENEQLLHKMIWWTLESPAGSFAAVDDSTFADTVSNPYDYGHQLFRMRIQHDTSSAIFAARRPAGEWLADNLARAERAANIDAAGGRLGKHVVPIDADIPATQPFRYQSDSFTAPKIEILDLVVGTLEPVEVKFITPLSVRLTGGNWTDSGYNNEVAGEPLLVRTADRFRATIAEVPGVSSVCYSVHGAQWGWSSSRCDGTDAALLDDAVDALQISLNNTTDWSVCYQVHADGYGWTNWACDGTTAGVPSSGYPINAVRVRMHRKPNVPVQDSNSGQPIGGLPSGGGSGGGGPGGGCTDPNDLFC